MTDTATSPFIPVFAPASTTFVRGAGTELWDDTGKRYLDFLGGLAVISLGHANPAIAEALTKQSHTLWHVSNLFANDVAVATAHKLSGSAHEVTGEDGQVFFCNSGAEANEAAIKLARAYGSARGRYKVVTTRGRLPRPHARDARRHGQPKYHAVLRADVPGFPTSPTTTWTPSPPRSTTRRRPSWSSRSRAKGASTSPPPDYLPRLRKLCDERGVLLILDEVQTGMGRTGDVVRLRARRDRPGRRDAGQGPRRRRSDRCDVGQARRRRRVPSPAITAAPSAARRWPRRWSVR